ncbi:dihydroorotate dehydrogenase electron transfer subunit [Oceanobacillus kapialis]|uniref:Dihydroorotate dehydrogenase B (NAD(+)), electron transfer subunit n=1 Tax=Oceanobacillus kapialis TaxID=481353 RepID=A0ABW5PY86_9BACI
MRKIELVVKQLTEIAKETYEMVLENSFVSMTAIAGQFLHLQIEGHILRRPISIASVDPKSQTVTIIFKVNGPGTKHLAGYQPNSTLNALGPAGNGFNLEIDDKTVLLIGGGIGVPPLYHLGKKLIEKEKNIISILGFQSKDYVFYEKEFQQLGKTYIVTNDGSYGESGFVTDMLGEVEDFDSYYSCGPIPMLQAVSQKLVHKNGFISLEERMGCGVGACFACVIPSDTEAGYRKICKDGPVFHHQEVSL